MNNTRKSTNLRNATFSIMLHDYNIVRITLGLVFLGNTKINI